MDNNNNKITLTGVIADEPKFSHEILGEEFYFFKIACSRKSNAKDTLRVMVSDRLADIKKIKLGQAIKVKGQIRSFNEPIPGINKSHLKVFVFAQEIKLIGKDIAKCDFENKVEINGYITKQHTYRTTLMGREIFDMTIAVSRGYNKSDYIPSIAWGRNARFACNLETGAFVHVEGRFQSREYTKKLDGDIEEIRTAYELSISCIKRIEEV